MERLDKTLWFSQNISLNAQQMVRASYTFHGPVHNNVCVCVCKSTFVRISASRHFIEGSAFIKPHNTFASYWSNNAVLKFIIMMLWLKFTTGCQQAWQHIIWRSSKMSSGWTKQFCSWESLHLPFLCKARCEICLCLGILCDWITLMPSCIYGYGLMEFSKITVIY